MTTDSMKKLQSIMTAFGEKNEIENFALDEEGACGVNSDEDVTFFLQYLEDIDSLAFIAPVGIVKKEYELEMYKALLQANMLWEETEGATLAFDPESEEIVLQISADLASLDLETFESLMEDFVSMVEEWQDLIANFDPSDLDTIEDEQEN